MGELALGIVILLSLVGLQVGARRLALWQAQKAWSTGNDALKRNDWQAAERAFRVCVKKVPIWTAGHTMLGIALANQGKLDPAQKCFHMAAGLDPKNPDGYLGLLHFYATHRPGDMQRAADALRKAFDKDPSLRDKLRGDGRLEKLREDPALKPLFE